MWLFWDPDKNKWMSGESTKHYISDDPKFKQKIEEIAEHTMSIIWPVSESGPTHIRVVIEHDYYFKEGAWNPDEEIPHCIQIVSFSDQLSFEKKRQIHSILEFGFKEESSPHHGPYYNFKNFWLPNGQEIEELKEQKQKERQKQENLALQEKMKSVINQNISLIRLFAGKRDLKELFYKLTEKGWVLIEKGNHSALFANGRNIWKWNSDTFHGKLILSSYWGWEEMKFLEELAK